MKYLVFGSLNIDKTYSVPHFVAAGETLSATKMELFCGGKGFNQAVALARAGGTVHFAGAVGLDGKMLLEALEREAIHTRHIKHTDGATGHAIIQVEPEGQNSIIILPGANGTITEHDVDVTLADFEQGDMIILQNEISCISYILRRAAEKGMIVALNPSPYDERIAAYDMNCVDYLLINEVEGTAIAGTSDPMVMMENLRLRYPRMNLVLTLGCRGAVYCNSLGQCFRTGIYRTIAQDTTAAGDTFTGYFLLELTSHGNPELALQRAAIASGISVSRKGAAPSIPTRQEVIDTETTAVLCEFC